MHRLLVLTAVFCAACDEEAGMSEGGCPAVVVADAGMAAGQAAIAPSPVVYTVAPSPAPVPVDMMPPFGRVLRVMPIGDSGTFGPNVKTPDDPMYRAELYANLTAAGYPIQFVGSMPSGDATLPASQWANEGHPGYLTLDYLYQLNGGFSSILSNFVKAQSPLDVALLEETGTNDCYAGGSYTGRFEPESIPERVAAEVRQIHARAPNATIIVGSASPVPARYYLDARACIDATNTRLPGIIEYERSQGIDVWFCDRGLVDADVCHYPDSGGWPSSTGGDCIHLNSIGKIHDGDAWAACFKAHVPLGSVVDAGN